MAARLLGLVETPARSLRRAFIAMGARRYFSVLSYQPCKDRFRAGAEILGVITRVGCRGCLFWSVFRSLGKCGYNIFSL